MRGRTRALWVCAGIASTAAFTNAQQIEPIVWQGAQVPGEAPGVVFGILDQPLDALGDAPGTVAFSAQLRQSFHQTGRGIFSWVNGTLSSVAVTGQIAPSANGTWYYSDFGDRPATIDASGDVAFQAGLSTSPTAGPGLLSLGSFFGPAGNVVSLAQSGEPVNSLGGTASYSIPNVPEFDGSGHLALGATLSGTALSVPWVEEYGIGAEPRIAIAASGMQAPGLAAGVQYSQAIGPPGVSIRNGQCTFISKLAGVGVVSGVNDSAIFGGPAAAVTALVRTGSAAPIPGAIYSSFPFQPSYVDPTGGVTFVGNLTGPSIQAGVNDTGVFRAIGGTTEKIAQAGDPAPEIDGTSLASPLVIGKFNDNNIFFGSFLKGSGITGSNNYALFRRPLSGGAAILMARNGDQAPDEPASISLGNIGNPFEFNNGDLLFQSTLSNSSGDIIGDALYLSEDGKSFHALLQTGQAMELSDGTFTPILTRILPNNFNADGTFVIKGYFQNGSSGLFQINVVPEPATVSIILFAGAVAGLARRRRLT